MARNVRLDDIFFGDAEVDAALVKWREAIEGAHNWDVKGSVNYIGTKDGYTLHVKGGRGLRRAVVTTAIPAAPDANSVSNTGRAKLRVRNGTALSDGDTGQIVYSDWSAVIPVGTRIMIEPDGDGWMLVGADFCPEA